MTTGVTPETEHLTYGPVAKRKCRDVIFLILFLAFWVGMAIIAWKGVQIGNPRRLKYGTDMYGAVCGFNNEGRTDLPEAWRFDLTNKLVLYYPTPFDPGMHFCIEHCPNDTVVTDVDQYICRYDITPSSMEVASGNCWPPYASSPIFNRCVPFGPVNGTVGFVDKQINAQEVSMQILSDVAQAWPWIAASAAVAFGIGLVWLIFIRFFTGLLVWLTILFVYVFFFGLTAFLLWQAKIKGDALDKLPEEERLDHDKRQHTALQVAGYVLIAIDVIMLLLLIWMRRRIALAIGILKQATKAVAAMPSILVFPAFTFAAQIAFAVYWIAIMVFIATAGQAKFNVSEDNNNATAQNNITEFAFTGMSQDNIIRGMQVYHLFGYFWTAEFVAAFGQICLALSVATWYWTKEKKDLPRFIVAGAVAKVFRYHLGSIAFGSLIIAIVRFIRAIIAYVQKRLKRYDNRLVKFLLKCLDCCFACFERFLKFINKRAYIMIAIKGESFCGAARSAFGLLLTNILRVGVVGVISNFLLFLGRVLITIGATLFGAYILSKDEDLHFWMIPVVIIAIIAYFISHCFMAVYDMAVDTILLCFCEDEAQGQHTHEYYNKDLKEFIDGAHKGICCC